MWHQLASFGLLLLILFVFLLPELIVMPNLQIENVFWPYLMSMVAASCVIYLTGMQANKRGVKLHILKLRFEYWAFVVLGLTGIAYLLHKTGNAFWQT